MNDILNTIGTTAQAMHWTEVFSVLFGIIYLVLAARQNPLCWWFGIVGCLLWAWAAFNLYDLYVDTLLQIFYVGISFLGIYQWKYGSEKKTELPITYLTRREHLMVIIGGLILTAVVGFLFDNYTDAAASYLDTFTTVFSVIITFMVIQKKMDNWAYWFVIDSVYVYLYWSRGGYLFALLFVVYLFIVVAGYFSWKRDLENSQTTTS
ncbi:MAG: nicotinamide riboside transporter PnuC [Saprospiraceae bacterium]